MSTLSLGDLNTLGSASAYRYAREQDLASASLGVLASTVVDVGVGIWNSLIPEATGYETSTSQVLQSIGADGILTAYENNTDLVNTLSFVGGVFIPGGAALKLSRAVRAGLKGTSFLSPVRHKDDLLKYQKLIEDGAQGSAEYKYLRRQMYARGQAENIMDTVAMEFAVIGTFNAHPFMEDYMKDPVENFGISLAIGGGLGAGLSAIASRTAIKAVQGATESAALRTVDAQLGLLDTPFSDTATTMANLDMAAKRLDYIAQVPEGAPGYKQIEKDMAGSLAASIRSRMTDLAEAKTSKDMLELIKGDKELQTTVLGRLADLRFSGTDKVSFFKLDDKGLRPTSLDDKQARANFTTLFTKTDGTQGKNFHNNVYYNPDLDAFITRSQANMLGNAADLGMGPAQLRKDAGKLQLRRVVNDFNESLLGGRTADIEALWLKNLSFYESQPTSKLLEAEFVKGDLPAVQGWLAAVENRKATLQAKLSDSATTAGEVASYADELAQLQVAKVKVFDTDRLRLVDMEEITAGVVPSTFASANDFVKPTHIADVAKAIKNREIRPLVSNKVVYSTASRMTIDFYRDVVIRTFAAGQDIRPLISPDDWNRLNRLGGPTAENVATMVKDIKRINLHNIAPKRLEQLSRSYADDNAAMFREVLDDGVDLSPSSSLMLIRWIAGQFEDKELLRSAVASARTMRAGMDSVTPFHDEVAEILKSPRIAEQREALLKHADAKGNVYMWRGMKTAATGDTPVSSYTFSKRVADGFGGAKLYKIHTDDMLGYLYNGESEWLVGTSTRDAFENLEAAKKSGAPKLMNHTAPRAFKEMDYTALQRDYLATKGLAVHQEVKEGAIPAEVIAARYNTTVDVVNLAESNQDIYGMMGRMLGSDTVNQLSNRWHSAVQIDEALSPARRTMQLSARENQHVGPMAEYLEKQREALLTQTNLDTQLAKALNEGDTLAQERIRAKLNTMEEMQAEINMHWVEATVAASKSFTASRMLDRVLNAGHIKVLRNSLGEFVNGKGGATLVGSADFVTRKMGEIGPLITANADQLAHIANETSQTLLDPIATQFRKLATDQAARTEFAVLDNIRQTVGGMMEYDAQLRKLVTHTRDAKGEILNTVEHSSEVVSDVVHKAFIAFGRASAEAMELQRVNNRLGGRMEPASIGLWIPPASLKGKEYAYVNNLDNRSQKLLIGNNAEDLEELIAAYRPGPNERIVRRSEAMVENHNAFGVELERITTADISKQKRGIGSAIPDLSPQRLDEIITSYRDRYVAQITNMFELSNFDLMKKLEYVSNYNQRVVGNKQQTGWRKLMPGTQDTARDVKDLLLNRNPVYRNEFMGAVNSVGDAVIQGVSEAVNKAWEMARPSGLRAQVDYDKYTQLRQAAGLPNPFEAFEEAARPIMLERAKTMGVANPNRVVQIGNELATTLALKFMEVAQPIVNMLSLPILMTSTISRNIKAANINNPDDLLQMSHMAVMTNGVRRAFNTPLPDRNVMRMAEEEGLFDPILSEVDAVLKMSKFSSAGVGAQVDKVLNSKFVEVLSRPAVMTEALVRKVAFSTGLEQARRMYGAAASDDQIMLFARDFMKQAIGNYSPSQRPMVFQGSVGAAMGLFQTYMLTYAQNMYRHLELKDFKGLARMMLAQGGVFGAGSLPGFQPISEQIAIHFSDENYDLTTATYRALPDPMASLLIYGLPSNLGPALHTRGDVAPRVPTGFDTMVAPSMVGQLLGAMVDMGKAITQTDVGAGHAFFEALSTQSVSRPIARMSELVTGHSITGPGMQMQGPEEVWSFTGIVSRVLSTRPLREQKRREVDHLNSMYGAIDRENRQAVIQKIRSAIRNDTLTNEMMDKAAIQYLRTGSPQGFRQAINQAFMDNEQSTIEKARTKFHDSPLMLILDDLD